MVTRDPKNRPSDRRAGGAAWAFLIGGLAMGAIAFAVTVSWDAVRARNAEMLADERDDAPLPERPRFEFHFVAGTSGWPRAESLGMNAYTLHDTVTGRTWLCVSTAGMVEITESAEAPR